LTPAGLPPSAGATLEIAEISHDLREEEGLHAALDSLQALAVIADEVLSGIMVRRNLQFTLTRKKILDRWSADNFHSSCAYAACCALRYSIFFKPSWSDMTNYMSTRSPCHIPFEVL
jgi:hypothetical protein